MSMRWSPRLAVSLALAVNLLAREAHAGDRVAKARAARSADVRKMFEAAQVAFPPGEIYLRAFKAEGELELWAGPKGKPLTRVKTYRICAKSGGLGPKREEGDLQVPEGFYRISDFNPWSNFYLSLGLDYPNASDRVRGTKGRLGGAIYLHGGCATIGCIPIEDAPVEEVYLVALEARAKGQSIPIHVFPHRMDPAGMAWLEKEAREDAALVAFWRELAPGYTLFEQSRRPPSVSVEPKTGRYRVSGGH